MSMEPSTNWRHRWGLDGRLLLWMLLVAGGFAWVAMVQCGRGHPFEDRSGGYTQFVRMMLLALVLYPVAPMLVLRSWQFEGTRALWSNLVGYVLPYFIGLQFFYLQRIDAINFSLNYHDFTRMGPVAVFVFSLLGLLVVALLVLHVRWARQAGILWPYTGAFVGAVLFIVVVTVLVRDTRHLHIHHWFLTCFFVPFARFANPVSRTAQAVCAAIAVEGVAEWSMATIWELN